MSYFKISIVTVALMCVALVDLGSQQQAEAKSAIISRRGNATHVTYMYSNYSLRRVPDYPSLQYHALDVRQTGNFRHLWIRPSLINW